MRGTAPMFIRLTALALVAVSFLWSQLLRVTALGTTWARSLSTSMPSSNSGPSFLWKRIVGGTHSGMGASRSKMTRVWRAWALPRAAASPAALVWSCSKRKDRPSSLRRRPILRCHHPQNGNMSDSEPAGSTLTHLPNTSFKMRFFASLKNSFVLDRPAPLGFGALPSLYMHHRSTR